MKIKSNLRSNIDTCVHPEVVGRSADSFVRTLLKLRWIRADTLSALLRGGSPTTSGCTPDSSPGSRRTLDPILVTLVVFAGLIASGGSQRLLAADLKTDDKEKIVYQNNFETSELDSVPDTLLVLDGAFGVKQDGANKFLELPGAPLDTFGTLFGPTETAGIRVSARIRSKGKGRLFPTFAVGLGGVGGYRLQVSPGKRLLELSKGDETVTSSPFAWDPAGWTFLSLQIRKVKDHEWQVEGKVWKQGVPEPEMWVLSQNLKTEPSPGRPSIWGSPYAGTPIQFDDLTVWKME